jgi:hypothetical protein
MFCTTIICLYDDPEARAGIATAYLGWRSNFGAVMVGDELCSKASTAPAVEE